MKKDIEQDRPSGPHHHMFGQSCSNDLKLFIDEQQYSQLTSKINDKGKKYHFSMAKRRLVMFSFLLICVAYILVIRFSFNANTFYWYIPLIVFTFSLFLIQIFVPEYRSKRFYKSCIKLIIRHNQDPRATSRGTVYEMSKVGTNYHLIVNYINSTAPVIVDYSNTANAQPVGYGTPVPPQPNITTTPYFPQPTLYVGPTTPYQTTPPPPPNQNYQID